MKVHRYIAFLGEWKKTVLVNAKVLLTEWQIRQFSNTSFWQQAGTFIGKLLKRKKSQDVKLILEKETSMV